MPSGLTRWEALTDAKNGKLERRASPDEIWVPEVIQVDESVVRFDFDDIVRTVSPRPDLWIASLRLKRPRTSRNSQRVSDPWVSSLRL